MTQFVTQFTHNQLFFSRSSSSFTSKTLNKNRRSVQLQVQSGFTFPSKVSLHHLCEGKADLTQISIISSTLNSSFCRWESLGTHSGFLWEFLSPFSRACLSQIHIYIYIYRHIYTHIYIYIYIYMCPRWGDASELTGGTGMFR